MLSLSIKNKDAIKRFYLANKKFTKHKIIYIFCLSSFFNPPEYTSIYILKDYRLFHMLPLATQES